MIAAWYDRQGPAAEVFQVGEMGTAEPGPGEVRVRLTLSGVNPGDIKKRQAWLGSPMAFPRIVPHSDGAGIIEAVGPGADPVRVGRRVWVYGAQSYRPFGTAAQTTVVPETLAVDLPDAVSDEMGACLGIPGITAHRAVFADGPVSGQTVLVHGVRGSVRPGRLIRPPPTTWSRCSLTRSLRSGGWPRTELTASSRLPFLPTRT